METDKLTLEDRLIDFKTWQIENGYNPITDEEIEDYIKSNHSSNKDLALDVIENKGKICDLFCCCDSANKSVLKCSNLTDECPD